MPTSCPRGHIRRKAYTVTRRGKQYHVKSACIKGRGKSPSRKGPRVIPKLRKGTLKKYGYSLDQSATARHTALRKAVKAYGASKVFKKLNAVMVLQKYTSPKNAAKFRADRNWVRKTFARQFKTAMPSKSRTRSRSPTRKKTTAKRKRSKSPTRKKTTAKRKRSTTAGQKKLSGRHSHYCTKDGRKYQIYVGPKGGWYINKGGKKTSLDKGSTTTLHGLC